MVISSCGALRVWEIGNTCRMIVSTSAAHLAAPGASLLSCTLYNGMPHVAFTNARAYMYHKDMGIAKSYHFSFIYDYITIIYTYIVYRDMAVNWRQSGPSLAMVIIQCIEYFWQ